MRTVKFVVVFCVVVGVAASLGVYIGAAMWEVLLPW